MNAEVFIDQSEGGVAEISVVRSATSHEVAPGDRVEGLGDFGKPIGEFGAVERANEEDAVVKWDDDGRMRIRQPSLKKV